QRLLRTEVVAELLESYRFLRVLENRLQQWNDEQTHRLPEDAAGRARLARSLDFASWDALSAEIERHRQRVAHHFAAMVFAPEADAGEAGTALRTLDLEAGQQDRERLVETLGYSDPGPICEVLERLRESVYYRRLDA